MVSERLPFAPGSERWRRRLEEALRRGEEPVEVDCFGTDKYKILGKKVVVRVRIYNEKLGIWEDRMAVEYYDVCPVCGRLMLVRALEGTTYLACCSEECYEEFDRITGVSKGEP